jgi:GTP-binding protein HflX
MLIQAFTSTLEDSVQADVLLHVVDASDPMIEDKIQVVEDILDQIGAEQERYLIFNKVDLLEVDREQARLTFAVIAKKFGYENKWKMTSVATGEGVDEVREWLEEWAV